MHFCVLLHGLAVSSLLLNFLANCENGRSSFSLELDFFKKMEANVDLDQRENSKPPISNAYNLDVIESQVDVRTGELRFAVPIGYYNILTESVRIELRFSSNMAINGNDDWKLGFGWYLNFPYIKYFKADDTALYYPGDGSSMVIKRVTQKDKGSIKYHLTEDYYLQYEDSGDLLIQRNGERFIFEVPNEDGKIGNLKTYYSSNMASVNFRWTYSTKCALLFIDGNACGRTVCATVKQCQEGSTRYSTKVETFSTISTAGEKLGKLTCEIDTLLESTDANQPYLSRVNTTKCVIDLVAAMAAWRFVRKQGPISNLQSRLIEKIVDMQTGYEEEVEWYEDNLEYLGITACQVHRLLKKYGSNKNLKFRITPQSTLMEYYYGKHSYLGSPYFAMKTGIYDDYLIETMGVYKYESLEKLDASCIKHTFDHFHREYETTLYKDCIDFETKLERVLTEYPCTYWRDFNFETLTYACKEHKHYLYPANVTKIHYEHHSDGTISEYRETTEYIYDDHGKMIKRVEPNGMITSVTYETVHGDNTNGALRLVKTINVTATVCNSNWKSCQIIVENEYEAWLGVASAFSRWYPLLKKSKFYYLWEKKLTLYKEVKYQRFNNTPDPLRISGKTQWESTVYYPEKGNLQESWINFYYTSSDPSNLTYGYIWRILKTIQVYHQNTLAITEECVIDLPTGLTVQRIEPDETRILYKYDIVGRIFDKIILSNDNDEITLFTKYGYADKEYENSVTIVNKGEKIITKLLLDNYRRTQEIQISNDWKTFYATHLFEYNNINQLSTEYAIVDSKKLKTEYKYNEQRKLIQTTYPNGIKENIEYGVTSDGLVERKYYESKELRSPVECVFLKYGIVFSKGVVLERKKHANVSCNNYVELLWMKNYTYNSFMKPLEVKLFKQDGTVQYKRTYQYDYLGRLQQEGKYNEAIDLESSLLHSYNYLNQETEISVYKAHGTKPWILGERRFDIIGRLETETIGGIQTEYEYNPWNQMCKTWIRSVKLEGVPPSHRGYKNITTNYNGLGLVKNRTAYLFKPLHYNENKLNSIAKAAVTLQIFYDELARIDRYKVLRKTKNFSKKFKYNDLLNSVNNVEIDIDGEIFKTLATTMDPPGRVTHGTDFTGITFNNTFDDNNQLTKVEYYNTEKNIYYTLNIEYDGLGRLESTNFVSNTGRKQKAMTTYVYNNYGFLERQRFFKDDKKFGIIEYTYDNLGRLIEKLTDGIAEDIVTSRIREKYYYDGVKVIYYQCANLKMTDKDIELQKWKCPQMTDGVNIFKTTINSQNYTYDIFNNIVQVLTKSDKNQILHTTYNYTDKVPTRLLNVKFEFNGNGQGSNVEYETFYHYDSGGNVIETRKTRNHQIFSYWMKNKYDALDKPYYSNYKFGDLKTDNEVYRTHDEDGSLYYYKHKHDDEILQNVHLFRDENGVLLSEQRIEGGGSHIYAAGKKVSYIHNSQETNYFLDSAGSVLASIKGTKVETDTFLPFGSCSRNSTKQRIGFQNMWTEDLRQIIDTENGRTYDPTIGRFHQLDPINLFVNERSTNGYSFAMNPPIFFGDPSGETPSGREHAYNGISFRGLYLSMIPIYLTSGMARSFRIVKGSKSLSHELRFNEVIRNGMNSKLTYEAIHNRHCGNYCIRKFAHQEARKIMDILGYAQMGEYSSSYEAHAMRGADMIEFLADQMISRGWNMKSLIKKPSMWAYRRGMLNLPTIKEYVENGKASGTFNGMKYDQRLPNDVKLEKSGAGESAKYWTLLAWKHRFPDQLIVYEQQKDRMHNWIDVTGNNKISDRITFYDDYEIMLYKILKPNL